MCDTCYTCEGINVNWDELKRIEAKYQPKTFDDFFNAIRDDAIRSSNNLCNFLLRDAKRHYKS